MERSLAVAVHCPSQEHHTAFWPTTLPCKFDLCRRWSNVSCSLNWRWGSIQAYMNGKQNSAGFASQAEDSWNASDDEELLRLMEGFEDSLPIIRTYKNDLCSLEICGGAPRTSVLTAMAADKSYFAASNLLMQRPLTVLQTNLPGASGVNSTISTKLLAPTLQVVERAKRLSLPKGLSRREFMPKFFEAVEMLYLSKFYVEINAPKNSRDIRTLDKDENEVLYSFEATETGALNQVGEALTLYAAHSLQSKASGKQFLSLFKRLWSKPEWVPNHTSSVRFRLLSVEEIQGQIKHKADCIDPTSLARVDRLWWPVPALVLNAAKKHFRKATDNWIYEHVPIHKMHIDPDIFPIQGANHDGQPKQLEEFDLTHAQMVDLGGVFDLYYEDRFTLPRKNFQINPILAIRSVPKNKTAQFLDTMILGSAILGLAIFAWLVSARLRAPSKSTTGNLVLNTVDVAVISKTELPSTDKHDELTYPVNEQLPPEEMESLCKSVTAKLVEGFSWNVEIRSHPLKGAWTSRRTAELKTTEVADSSSLTQNGTDEYDTVANFSKKENTEHGENIKQIPVYQIALSRNGTVLGFQPLNEAAISSWAAMPFAQNLHNVSQLKAGLWERPLKFRRPPSDVVVLELQVDEASSYALARPLPL